MAGEPQPVPLELDPKYDDYDFPTMAPVAQNGHPGFLTPIQQAQVYQLRQLLESEGFTKRLDTLTLVWETLCKIRGLDGMAADTRGSCGSSAHASSMSSSPSKCEQTEDIIHIRVVI